MSPQQRLDELLREWSERRHRGESASPEELCRDCPELLDALRARIAVAEDRLRGAAPTAGYSDPSMTSAPPTSSLDPGSELGGGSFPRWPAVRVPGFEILGELGRGGMGVVYKARQLALKRVVALKMILGGAHAGEAHMARFQREAEAVAQLRHENIVQLYEIGAHEGCPYFALEYVEGGTLHALAVEHPLAPRRAAGLVEQIARGIHEAHALGIVHRDLKPANVLLTKDGVPKISDFGLAKQIQDDNLQTKTGAIVGTPSYMAPEQAEGRVKELGPLVDVYALGATLYDLLTGRPPFNGASMMDTLTQVRTEEPVAPTRLQPALPRDLETICLKCLAKEPRKRYSSAAALADDLHRFLEGRPITARPVGPVERTWRWCRRNKIAATLIVSLTLGVCATIGLTMWALGERDRADHQARKASESAIEQAAQRRRAEQELYHSLLARVRERTVTAQPGWTWQSLADLDKAFALKDVEADLVEARSLMAECLGRFDLREAGVLADKLDPMGLAFNRDGQLLAIGEKRNAVHCSIQVWHMPTGAQKALYVLPTVGASFLTALEGKVGSHEGFTSAAFSPDGRWLVAGTRHGRLCRWDTADPKPEAIVWKAHAASVHALAFSPDGRQLISGSSDKTMRWLPHDQWQGKPLDVNAKTSHAAFSPDGAFLAVAGGDVRLFHGPSFDLWPADASELSSENLAFSPDGRTLALQVRGDVALLDVERGRVFQMLRAPEADVEVAARGVGLSFSADGAVLADAVDNGRVRLWDVAAGKIVTTLVIPDRERPVPLFSPDGKFLVVGGNRRTFLYELRPPEIQTTMAQHPHALRHIAFAPDGQTLLCEGERKVQGQVVDGQVTQWEVGTGVRRDAVSSIAFPGDRGQFRPAPSGLAVHPKGAFAATASSLFGGFLWPLERPGAFGPVAQAPDRSKVIEFQEDAFQFVPDAGIDIRADPRASNGRAARIAAGTKQRLRVRVTAAEAKTHKVNGWAIFAVCRIEGRRRPGMGIQGATLAPGHEWKRSWDVCRFPQDGYHVVLLEYRDRGEETKFDWTEDAIGLDCPAGEPTALWVDRIFRVPFKTSRFDVSRQGPFAFAPDGKLWGVANENYVVSWHVPQLRVDQQWSNLIGATLLGSQRLQALAAGVTWVLAGADDGYVFFLSATTAKWDGQGWLSTEGGVRSVALDPAEAVAAVGTQEGRLALIRVPTGTVLADLPGHSRSVESVVFSQDGNWLISGSLDQDVRWWRRGAGGDFEHMMSLKAPPGRLAEVRLSRDGANLAILNGSDRGVRVWRLDRLKDRLRAAGIGWE
ncbi:MAG: WD40 repeat domain-containing serine/threonine-protein kinase [Gemmataceae bacterium]|nr:WD40 repeat domain-containing serine/threonine-protein kinase [Gemmataceae bacterium]